MYIYSIRFLFEKGPTNLVHLQRFLERVSGGGLETAKQ